MDSAPRRGALRVAAALVAAWALFFAPALLGGGQFLYRDAGRMHHPVKRWLAEELRRGHLPEWNPYAGMGVPLVAGSVDAPLHPLNALFLAAPFEGAFKAWVLLSVLGAGLGAAAWARALGRSHAGAAAAGLAFMLSGFVVSSTDNLTYLTTLATAPWLLGAAARAGAGARPALLGVALLSFLTAAGGDPMGWAVALALASAQPLLHGEGPRAPRVLRGAAVGAAGALAAAPVILPVLAWLPHSSRAAAFAAEEYTRWNLHPLRLLELVVPHLLRSPAEGVLYAGVFHAYAGNEHTTIPWVISIYAGASVVALAAFGAARDRAARRLLAVAALFAWMALGPHAGFGQLARHVPLLASFRYWEKLVVWVTLLLAMAAGAGVERLLAERRDGRAVALGAGAAAAVLGACWLGAVLAPGPLARAVQTSPGASLADALVANLREGSGAAAVSLALLAAAALLLARGPLSRLGPAAVLAVVALDLGAANVRAYVLSPVELVSERAPIAERLHAEGGLPRVVTPFRIGAERWPGLTQCEAGWRWIARTSGAAANVAQRVANFEAYTGMLPARLIQFWTRVPPAALAARAALWGFGAVVVPGVPGLVQAAGLPAAAGVMGGDPDLPAYVVRQAARPRVAIAARVEAAGRDRALEFALSADAAASDVTVVEGPVPGGYAPPAGEARLATDDGEKLVIDAVADRPALLVVNDEWADGWTAEVDGERAPILAANYRARGIWIPAGRHAVVLRYRTPLLREGVLLGAIAVVVLSWLALRGRRSGTGVPAPGAA